MPESFSSSQKNSHSREAQLQQAASQVEESQQAEPHPTDSSAAMASGSHQGGPGDEQGGDDWSSIRDPKERRRVQNRIAQRNYRVRKRNEQEEQARIAENQTSAGAAYTPPEPEDLARSDNPAGLPWGSYSIRHAVEASRARDAQSQATTREPSVGASSSGGGGSGGGSTTGGRR